MARNKGPSVSLSPSCFSKVSHQKMKSRPSESVVNIESLESYLKFYTGIPDYRELHHLSDNEFYEKLRVLKETQRQFSGNLGISSEEKSNHSSSNNCLYYEDAEKYCPHCQHDDILKGVDELSLRCQSSQLFRRNSLGEKRLHSHEVPLTSKIPLFDKIMAKQEERRRLNHAKKARELIAMVRPFSFTRKEEAIRQMGSLSTPDIHGKCPSRTSTSFRARPVPRHAYDCGRQRRRDEQFERALEKCMRAEEMLQCASLPPRMELAKKKFEFRSDSAISKVSKYSSAMTMTSSQSSPDLTKRNKKKSSVGRNNLASVLRMQSTRYKTEKDVQKNLDEQQRNELIRFKEKLIRMTPAWRSLGYNLDDDLEMRLEKRRQEAKHRNREHWQLMDEIYGRVYHMTPLFQNPERTVRQHQCAKSKRCRSLDNNPRVSQGCPRLQRRHSFHKTNMWCDHSRNEEDNDN